MGNYGDILFLYLCPSMRAVLHCPCCPADRGGCAGLDFGMSMDDGLSIRNAV